MPFDSYVPYRTNPHRRLRCENVDITISLEKGEHNLTVALAYNEKGCLHEINFVSRGKVGHGIDFMFSELGIQLSRAIQGRDPNRESDYYEQPLAAD